MNPSAHSDEQLRILRKAAGILGLPSESLIPQPIHAAESANQKTLIPQSYTGISDIRHDDQSNLAWDPTTQHIQGEITADTVLPGNQTLTFPRNNPSDDFVPGLDQRYPASLPNVFSEAEFDSTAVTLFDQQ